MIPFYIIIYLAVCVAIFGLVGDDWTGKSYADRMAWLVIIAAWPVTMPIGFLIYVVNKARD